MNQPKPALRHFLDLDQFSRDALSNIIRHGHTFKKQARAPREDLKGKSLALVFEKPSTRTRVSFEVGMRELAGNVISLNGDEIQLGHGESIGDTARVLSRFVHALMIRTYNHDTLLTIAQNAQIPVINGLTDYSHPCQVMADLMTVEERFHRLNNLTIAWLGDGGDNVLTSWMQAASLFNLEIKIACPDAYAPDPVTLATNQAKTKITRVATPEEAIKDAHIVMTDSWVSMHNADVAERHAALQPYQVNAKRMALAKPEAIFMHCLPAHREEEVSSEVMDGRQSVVFDQAENRLHVQKAILMWCFGKI